MIDFFYGSPLSFPIMIGCLGLMVGSFLNVVIHRLPIMLDREWRRDSALFLGQEPDASGDVIFNLAVPRSCCPACGKAIGALENIPLLSFMALRGRCSACAAPIPLRYPMVELLTAAVSAAVAWHFGLSLHTLAGLVLSWGLIALGFIDIDRQLLPDAITLPLLWLGLLLSVFNLYVDSPTSILGAVSGYLVLWLVFQLFRLLTGRAGMGYGDFKLLALLGAWQGWTMLPLILVMSSVAGAIIGGLMIVQGHRDHRTPIPFGPYLALAGWITLLWGDALNAAYMAMLVVD
jgi:leader peptidase (prepilin peptidase)/N-methyltransferase